MVGLYKKAHFKKLWTLMWMTPKVEGKKQKLTYASLIQDFVQCHFTDD